MKRYIAALDQGTTSSRCILFDQDQNILGTAQRELTQIYPQPGWVEQDPMEIWSTQYSVLTEVLAQTGISPMNWPPSASPTSGRPPLSGTKSPGGLFTTPSCGSAAALRRCASSSRRTGPLLITSRSTPACSSTPTSPPPSSAGSWTMWRGPGPGGGRRASVRHRGLLAGVEAHRRKGPYHRLHQRQPHDAL